MLRHVIDSQVHLHSGRSDISLGEGHGVGPFGASDLIAEMNGAKVDRAIVIPPRWQGTDNSLALTAAAQYPDRLGVMGRIAIEEPNAERVTRWRQQRGMLGIRVTFSGTQDHGWLRDGTADWLWAPAEEANIPIMIHAPGQLDAVTEIATAHPQLTLIVDHFGLPNKLGDTDIDAHIVQLLPLAELPNVATKATGLIRHSLDHYPHRSIHGVVERVLKHFGPKRVFWGTDFTSLRCSYREAKEMFTERMEFLTGEDLHWIMGSGVARWLRWPLDSPSA